MLGAEVLPWLGLRPCVAARGGARQGRLHLGAIRYDIVFLVLPFSLVFLSYFLLFICLLARSVCDRGNASLN